MRHRVSQLGVAASDRILHNCLVLDADAFVAFFLLPITQCYCGDVCLGSLYNRSIQSVVLKRTPSSRVGVNGVGELVSRTAVVAARKGAIPQGLGS